MDRLTRHEAIMAILGVPETYLSKVYKAGIIELLFENVTSLYVPVAVAVLSIFPASTSAWVTV